MPRLLQHKRSQHVGVAAIRRSQSRSAYCLLPGGAAAVNVDVHWSAMGRESEQVWIQGQERQTTGARSDAKRRGTRTVSRCGYKGGSGRQRAREATQSTAVREVDGKRFAEQRVNMKHAQPQTVPLLGPAAPPSSSAHAGAGRAAKKSHLASISSWLHRCTGAHNITRSSPGFFPCGNAAQSAQMPLYGHTQIFPSPARVVIRCVSRSLSFDQSPPT